MKILLPFCFYALKSNCIVRTQPSCLSQVPFKRFISSSLERASIFGSDEAPYFKPQRVVILARITRYEFEKLRYKNLSEDGLKEKVNWTGSKFS